MSMMILVPTRGRPENALRLQKACEHADVTLLFCVDDDDPKLNEYMKLNNYEIGPRLRLGGTLNHFAMLYADQYDIIGFMGDDVMPRTPMWDVLVQANMKKNGISYCNDGHQGENLPTAVFMDSNIIRKLGYMVLPGMTHLFIDNYWYKLAEALGTRTYLPTVYLEHLHPYAGKAENDQTYAEANTPKIWSEDEAKLKQHVESGGLDESVKKVLS